MQGFLQALLTFPAVVYTVLLGVVVLYWVSMVLGAVDLDLLGGAEHGGADGAVDAAHGHGDVASGGDGHADGAGDGHGDGHDHGGEVDGDGGVLGALGALGLRRLPMTLSVSLLVIWGWLISVLGSVLLAAAAARVMPLGVFRALLFAVAALASVKLASVTARPLVPVFVGHRASRREHLVGKVGEVSTGRVDGRFGQVLVADGGAGLLLDARFDGEALQRGDRVVVTAWDAERNVVQVEPLDRFTALRVEGAPAAGSADDAGAAKSGDRAGKRVLR